MILRKMLLTKLLFAALVLLLAACDGDDGKDGTAGAAGGPGSDGLTSLVNQTPLMVGNAECPYGGTRIDSGRDADGNGMLDMAEVEQTSYVCAPHSPKAFNRIASFPVCSLIDANCNDDTETAAEIVDASEDGMTLIFTDSPMERIGFVDITDPAAPAGLGTLDVGGEPTSVAVMGDYALVGVNTSADFINTSGSLAVIEIASRSEVARHTLAGQPDSVAISPDGRYAAVAIENERDEDLGDGAPPQLPAGSLDIIDLVGAPADWSVRNVDLTGLATLFPGDPEPEYVDINSDNIAALSLQENNHLMLIDLADGSIVNHFSAGDVDLTRIDASEEDPALIALVENQENRLREPDGLTWIGTSYIATADEGDLDGGSRGFTVFNTNGDVVFDSGNSLDHLAVRLGHYPDDRSGNKGNEPENAEYGMFGGDKYLFVCSERSSLIFVYDVADATNPIYKQTLPAGAGPEGVHAIPGRNLLVAASEADDRGDKIRSVVNIYRYEAKAAHYPTLASLNGHDGNPIAWSAMSGLSADPMNPNWLYAVEDSFYQQNRIFTIDVSSHPAQLVSAMKITDANGVFAAIPAVALADASVDDDDATRVGVFDEADLDALINDDNTINIDPEGVAKASDGGFWVASEGSGTVGDAGRPINSLNFIFKTDMNGVIENVITLPDAINANQLRFGFEGVTEWNGKVYVAFQRVWGGDTNVRIGIYDIAGASWSFLFYELEAPASQNGGWVGLSDITSLGNGDFLVVERDNQGGPDAAIKRLYRFNVMGLNDGDVVSKRLVRDLMDDLKAPGGLVYEKIEGSAVMPNGDVYIINDNDGVDDNSGETQLINLGAILN